MQSDLERAIDAIHIRFGNQALVRATRLPDVQPWPTGWEVIGTAEDELLELPTWRARSAAG